MYKKSGLVILAGSLLVGGVQAQSSDSVPETVYERSSYYFGLDLGSNLAQQIGTERVHIESVIQGLQDGIAQNDPRISMQQIQAAVTELQQELQAETAEQSEELRKPSQNFLAENSERDGVVVTESGLQYEIVEQTDTGASPQASDTVRVHYHGTLIDDTVFDSSVERGEPVEFPLDGVIPGWTEGVQLMTEGDTYRFFIPSGLAYGDQSVGNIPPYSALIFEVELLDVVSEDKGEQEEG